MELSGPGVRTVLQRREIAHLVFKLVVSIGMMKIVAMQTGRVELSQMEAMARTPAPTTVAAMMGLPQLPLFSLGTDPSICIATTTMMAVSVLGECITGKSGCTGITKILLIQIPHLGLFLI